MSCGKSVSATKQKKETRGFKDVHNHAKKEKIKWEKKAENFLQCPPRKFGYSCKKSNSCCMGKNSV